MFGAKSFFTNEPREHSIRSKNFSTILEIKQIDFLNVIKSNHQDYEEYLMTKDQLKLYNSYQPIQEKCFSCGKSTHHLDSCPFVNFIPDPFFIIKKQQFSQSQVRNSNFVRKKKRRFNALNDNSLVLNEILQLDSSIFSENEDDIENVENEEESSQSLKTVTLKEIQEEQSPNEKSGFPSKSSNLLDESNGKIESGIDLPRKVPNQKSQEEGIARKKTEDDLVFNKETNMRKTDFKRKTFKIKTVVKEKINNSQNLKKQSTFEKEKDKDKNDEKEKKQNDSNELFDFDFERCQSWNFYFPNGNSSKLIQKMSSALKQNFSPTNSISKFKQKIGRRLSKFHIRPSFNELLLKN